MRKFVGMDQQAWEGLMTLTTKRRNFYTGLKYVRYTMAQAHQDKANGKTRPWLNLAHPIVGATT
jgi:hypothetical protein